MGGLAPWHWVLILVVVLVVFGGKGKLSGLMGDAARGIKEFKNGLKDEEAKPPSSAEALSTPPAEREREKV
ncbi:MAG TPA: twin-arginine translocase TatA/TatE family subunit [Caulobacteraceae bacterium]|jgi:sec-independent protein translocase protein TatA|nr:twin-arginine translocase TatA/TatE family subunit [Caulobacteraceae bacterium]